jgi:hypothetical protein
MSGTCPPLMEALAQIEDPRRARGKRHPLPAILALAVAATLCGAHGYGAIAEWGRDHGDAFARALGFTRTKTPCAGALHYLFQRLDRRALERALAGWAQAVLAALPHPREASRRWRSTGRRGAAPTSRAPSTPISSRCSRIGWGSPSTSKRSRTRPTRSVPCPSC